MSIAKSIETEYKDLRECKTQVESQKGRQSLWRCNPSMVKFEAFLLSRGLNLNSAYTMCQRVHRVANRAGGLTKLSQMDASRVIPILFQDMTRKYQVSLETGVREYQRSNLAWKKRSSILSEFLVRDLTKPIPSWRDEPLLIKFHHHLIESEHIEAIQANGLCQRIFFIAYKAYFACYEELRICDIDYFVNLHFSDKARSCRLNTRRAIRYFQKFLKLGGDLDRNS